MAKFASARYGIQRWTADGDTLARGEFDNAFATLDTFAAIDFQGTLGARPAAGVAGRYYYATDNGRVYRDNGSVWVTVTQAPQTAGLPVASTHGDTGSLGVASEYARADHRHAREAPGANSLVLAKGDLLGGSDAGQLARLAAPALRQFLMGDPAAATGLSWSADPVLGSRMRSDLVAPAESTGLTAYGYLPTPGPSVVVTMGPSGLALVMIGSVVNTPTFVVAGYASVATTGAGGGTDLVANDAFALAGTAGLSATFVGLAAFPPNTTVSFFTQYRSSNAGSNCLFFFRRLLVLPL